MCGFRPPPGHLGAGARAGDDAAAAKGNYDDHRPTPGDRTDHHARPDADDLAADRTADRAADHFGRPGAHSRTGAHLGCAATARRLDGRLSERCRYGARPLSGA